MPGGQHGDNDEVTGGVGDSASRVALGKDIQQMIVALDGNTSRADGETLRKVLAIVLGDGLSWDGVMQDLRRIRELVANLTGEVQTLKQEVRALQVEIDERRETSHEMLWTLRIVLAVVSVLALAYMWGAFGG